VQASNDFYTEMGCRLTDYTETDDSRKIPGFGRVDCTARANVHDLAFHQRPRAQGCIISEYDGTAKIDIRPSVAT